MTHISQQNSHTYMFSFPFFIDCWWIYKRFWKSWNTIDSSSCLLFYLLYIFHAHCNASSSNENDTKIIFPFYISQFMNFLQSDPLSILLLFVALKNVAKDLNKDQRTVFADKSHKGISKHFFLLSFQNIQKYWFVLWFFSFYCICVQKHWRQIVSESFYLVNMLQRQRKYKKNTQGKKIISSFYRLNCRMIFVYLQSSLSCSDIFNAGTAFSVT